MTTLNLQPHISESDPEVNNHFQSNKAHFNEQAYKVLNIILKGVMLTQLSAANNYGIFSLSTRISEIFKAGIDIKKDWTIPEGSHIKVRTYFLMKEEIERISKMKIV